MADIDNSPAGRSRPVSERYKLGLEPYSSHVQILQLIGPNQRVLEFGCAGGFLTRLLAEQSSDVVGIEVDPAAAALAAPHCSQIIVADLNTLEALPPGTERFDVLVFGDVLEHLIDPLAVLTRFLPYLRSGGQVIVSVPNVANLRIRWELLRGRWDYTETDILDRTHLRFFTRKTLRHLLQQAGLEITAEQFVPGVYQSGLYRRTLFRPLRKLGVEFEFAHRLTDLAPGLFAFQMVFVARPRRV